MAIVAIKIREPTVELKDFFFLEMIFLLGRAAKEVYDEYCV